MTDGAHLGVNAKRAVESILGGADQPEEDERLSPEEMERTIRASTTTDTYEECGNRLARYMLEFLDAHPEIDIVMVPPSDLVELEPVDGQVSLEHLREHWENRKIIAKGFDTIWQETDHANYRAAMDDAEPTGFLYGWAYNAVRYIKGYGPTENPAILTLE